MKQFSVLFLCMFALLANIACADKRKALQVSDLPKEAQKFINENFSSAKVVKVDNEGVSKSYEVYFDNGNSIDFNRKGQWTDIDCEGSEVP